MTLSQRLQVLEEAMAALTQRLDALALDAPRRDPASSTSCGTDRRATRTARDPAAPPPPVSGGAFGFTSAYTTTEG